MSNVEMYTRMYQTPEWFDHEQAELMQGWFAFEQLDLRGIYSVAGMIGIAEDERAMPEGKLNIYEFGSGLGEGLVALDMFARGRGDSNVRGSESTPPDRRTATQVAETLEMVTGVDKNGFDGLRDMPNAYDLVVAHMFGPSYDDAKSPALFIPIAQEALTEKGIVVINSDEETMRQVIRWSKENIQKGKLILPDTEKQGPGFMCMPHVIIKK